MNRKPTIVHVTSSLKQGGAEAILYTLISLLGDEFNHQVIYWHDGPYRARLEAMGVACHRITGLLAHYDPISMVRFIRILRTMRADVVHSLLWVANVYTRIACRLLGIPFVSALHNNAEQDGFIRNALDRITRAGAADYIAVSAQVAQQAQVKGIGHERMIVIANGFDPSCCGQEPYKDRTQLGLLPTHKILLTVGRFVPVKNYPFLLECFARLVTQDPDCRLIIIGTGPLESYLYHYAIKLGCNHAVTWVVNETAVPYYPLADVFVLTSDKEGISVALLEAMYHGIPPVVTSNEPQHPVIIHAVNGLIVPARDHEAFIKNITTIINDNTLGARLGQAASQTSRMQFNAQTMAERYKQVFYQRIMSARNVHNNAQKGERE